MLETPLVTHLVALSPLVALAALLAAAADAGAAPAADDLDPARIKAVAAMLPEKPAGLGPTITDRAAWDRLAAEPAAKDILARAEELLTKPIPDQPDDLYLEYSRDGNRSRFQAVAFERRGRLTPLVLAECLENKGRFIKAIAALVDALAAEKTWVLPAHDGNLKNFEGKTIDIDLFSSAVGWHLATTDRLLGDKLPPATRQTLRDNIARRILDPYTAMITGKRGKNGWLTTTNNWNAVCLAGVTGAGLAQLESREDRARFVVAAETYSRNFLAGFTPDGYCSEGLGYWNYGFGHYVLLSETVRRATAGQVDLLARPEARAPATFASRIQIIGGVAPAFADCAVGAKPSAPIMHFLNRRFGLGLTPYDTLDLKAALPSVSEAMIFAFPEGPVAAPPAAAAKGPALRDWFEQAGVLICRPAPGSDVRLGVALKGGHNAEHHNHNDVGSYVVVLGDQPILLDPGAEVYTARTFSAKRYDSKLLNSFGHPVPLVAGQLQQTGRKAEAKVIRTEFTDDADTLELDLTAAYAVPDLKTLRRTFVYSRVKPGGLTVTDDVEFQNPQTFSTPILTRGKWKNMEGGVLMVTDGKESVYVSISASGTAITFEAEEIREDAPVKPTRVGITLFKPVTSATVTLKIRPLTP
jgi:hypothetical protein